MENNINDDFDSSSSDESDKKPDSEDNGEFGSDPDSKSKNPFENLIVSLKILLRNLIMNP